MIASYLDLHIIDFCQLNCKHCYLKRDNENLTIIDTEMLKNICRDFLNTDFLFSKKSIILSGGEPLLHPKFAEICDLVRMLVGSVRLSTNGILIPNTYTFSGGETINDHKIVVSDCHFDILVINETNDVVNIGYRILPVFSPDGKKLPL